MMSLKVKYINIVCFQIQIPVLKIVIYSQMHYKKWIKGMN
jgi:hypothetical protein